MAETKKCREGAGEIGERRREGRVGGWERHAGAGAAVARPARPPSHGGVGPQAAPAATSGRCQMTTGGKPLPT
jgi:hypothetical protein